MKSRKSNNKLSHEDVDRIVRRYDTDELRISEAYRDGGIDPLWGRFTRAVGNQIDSGEATLPRYAIWANTVRDNIVGTFSFMESSDTVEAKRLMIRAVNSLSAFSDVQAYFDPFELGEK